MTRNKAFKYAEIFELMGDPQALYMLSLLEDKKEPMSLKELTKSAKTSTSEARRHLEGFERESVIRETHENGETYYEFGTTNTADGVKRLLERMNY